MEETEKIAEAVAEKIIERKKEEEINPFEKKLSDPLTLVKLLSSYEVPIDSKISTLIKRIKKKGRKHLREEIRKIKSGGD